MFYCKHCGYHGDLSLDLVGYYYPNTPPCPNCAAYDWAQHKELIHA